MYKGSYVYMYLCIYVYMYIVIDHTGNGCPPPNPPRRAQNVFPFQATNLITAQSWEIDPEGSKSYPNSRQRLDAKCSYGFWGPLVQSSKCGLAQSLWLKTHGMQMNPPSPYPMGTPEPCMCYGCELWLLTL